MRGTSVLPHLGQGLAQLVHAVGAEGANEIPVLRTNSLVTLRNLTINHTLRF
jgi:hypothetical protein